MHRDLRLHGLSSDHHHALVLARSIGRAFEEGTADVTFVAEVQGRYRDDLLPHFGVEEEILLPALARAGERGLVERTLNDHQEMAELVSRAADGDLRGLQLFGERLQAHVRFEERELFPACEKLPAEVLDAVAVRAPKPASGGAR